ncbi:C-type lectin domain-containing protein [Methylophilus sp. 14]|uniref:C-type lectin domain-containing protein n=1 Tax=Methylophilus sp. 14 TaxID=2781019 RepID=UPI0018904192|nr:C-type lectin domain-containing protein [Methylophilus sp. 14]MBF4989135.1 PEP-CTERM sorting domain-containing protein [Methylophilus sp. 14]
MRYGLNLLGISMLAAVSANAQAAMTVLATDTYNGSTYQLLSADTWTNSEAFAQSLGGHLVTINDLAENDWLTTEAFNGWGLNNAYWIGYSRNPNNPSQFLWADGSTSTYTNWSPGEPNNSNSYNADAENYVHTYLYFGGGVRFGKWNDLANVDPFEGPKFGVMQLVSTPTTVPEPSSAGLLGLGVLLMSLIGFRRQK